MITVAPRQQHALPTPLVSAYIFHILTVGVESTMNTNRDGVRTSEANTDHQGHPPLSDKHFLKWLKSHRPMFSWACFDAFRLKDYPERVMSHIFFVVIELHAQLQTRKKAKCGVANQFHITRAILLTHNDFLQEHPEADAPMSKLGHQMLFQRIWLYGMAMTGTFSNWCGNRRSWTRCSRMSSGPPCYLV